MESDDLLDRFSVPMAVLAALVVILASALVVASITSSATYSTYNDDWNGSSGLESVAGDVGVESVVARSPEAYAEAPADRTVALVLSPDSSKADRMREFVRNGGTLVVAADFGSSANDLLRSLGTDARVDGRLLRDPRSNYRSSAMPVATNVTQHRLVAGVKSLTLNYGTTVEPHGATPLVNTSRYAYLDANSNGRLDANESMGTRPVATVERVGEGRVVVVGDPSVFINAMLERPGNRRFVRVLVAQHDRLLLDYPQTESLPPLMLALLAVRDSAVLQFGLGVLVVGALAVWSRRPDPLASLESRLSRVRGRVGGRSDDARLGDVQADDAGPSASALADHLERRHPDWERERVERVVSALERRRNR